MQKVSSKAAVQSSVSALNTLSSVPTKTFISQMPNVNFGVRYPEGEEGLYKYESYYGNRPPRVEMEKYRLTSEVAKSVEQGDYMSAISGKIALARICQEQGNTRDAFLLEEGIRRLYSKLPSYDQGEAKTIISTYNPDMARYIDEDIKKM